VGSRGRKPDNDLVKRPPTRWLDNWGSDWSSLFF
jgi:hypothetical protein